MVKQLSADELRQQISRLDWHHSIDLGNGIVTPGAKPPEYHRQEAAAFFSHVDLVDASLIDIGAWNGYYSFEAERRGAGRVVAADAPIWEARCRGRETFDLARAALNSRVEALQMDLFDMSPAATGKFDVVLLAGVLYHLKDPLKGLAIAASLAEHLLIVETHLDVLHLDRPAMAFYPGKELGGDPTNWWGPNPACVVALLRDLGFAEIEVSFLGVSRGVFHAWRRTERRCGEPGGLPALNRRQIKLRAAWRLCREAFGLR